jgi:hypothetical protein
MKLEKVANDTIINMSGYFKINNIIFYMTHSTSKVFALSSYNKEAGLIYTKRFTFYELIKYIKNV